MIKQWEWPSWVIAAVLLGVGIVVQNSFWFPTDHPADHVVALATAIATALATVFALVVPAVLVIIQLSSQYSHRIAGSSFGMFTGWYLFFLGLSIIVSFAVVARPTAFNVRVSFLAMTLSVSLLVPYLVSLVRWLSPLALVEHYAKRANRELKKEPAAVVPSVEEKSSSSAKILQILESLLERHDYDLFDKCFEYFATKVLVPEKADSRAGAFAVEVIQQKLSPLCHEHLARSSALLHILSELSTLGFLAIERQCERVVSEISCTLRRIAQEGLATGHLEVVHPIVSGLVGLANHALNHAAWGVASTIAADLKRLAQEPRIGQARDLALTRAGVKALGDRARTFPDTSRAERFNEAVSALHNALVKLASNDPPERNL